MTERPPSLTKQDVEHLRILAILHYVMAGLAVLSLGFVALHFLAFRSVLGHQKGPGPPDGFLLIFRVVYATATGYLGGCVLLNFLSASNLRERRSPTLSLIAAGFNCLMFPHGTALGVFTFIVLTRNSVRDAYEYAENSGGWFEERDTTNSK